MAENKKCSRADAKGQTGKAYRHTGYIFFDNASTTKIDDRIFEAMLPFLTEKYGNPSSLHVLGQEANNSIEAARKSVAALIGSKEDEIFFTSCSTESNNMALWGILKAYKDKGNHIITSAIEHFSILNPLKELQREGWEVTILPVDRYGFVDPESIKKAIKKTTVLVSIMHANNEIGTIQKIRDISNITGEAGIVFHSDCTATAGIIPVDVTGHGFDCISFSAQQMYGPKGAAALYLKRGTRLRPILQGGIQESGKRSGTENVAAIAGFGQAARLAKSQMTGNAKKTAALRNELSDGIMNDISEVVLNGHPSERLPGNLHLSFKYIEGESIILLLDSEGIAASSGSSCASHALKSSHVLTAINTPVELVNGSILFSLGKYNTSGEVKKVLKVLPKIVDKLRQMSPLCR